MTLFYTRGQLGFRLAIFFGSALLAAAFSGLISYGVFRIKDSAIKGWMWLFIIEGGLTVITGVVAFFWLPGSPQNAWFLNSDEKNAAITRALRDGSRSVGNKFSLNRAFVSWKSRRFAVLCVISFTYPVAFATTSNFLPQVSQELPLAFS